MIDKIKTISRNKLVNKLALIPMLGSILMIISIFTPFAISEGLEGISISSQSSVWYWGIYQEQDQIFSLNIPFMLNIFLSMAMFAFAILILILSIEFGLNNLKRKLFGEVIFIFIVLILFSMTLTIRLIEYAFSLMPDLEPVYSPESGIYYAFWSYRLSGFGHFGISIAIFLVVIGSLIALVKSRKSFFYIEITAVIVWIISYITFLSFLF